ncbi:hypothetical protein OZX69_01420 [Lactobacillus sp. ESL0731]|uniref:hypothetical protein n=1 Tax=unclassified Lactobacillus TaxID=2620435 RepID=UPI0023F62CE2|nr:MULTISPECIES: hypothetical protein [unclassified Lactobacillus]WEV51409.1 hypothetical protein OZX63_01420 [Lactobacillus sp. ESL0700]WEV62539.1 hypothetical protein OZX69_01420 [Lactobacillus sp. ESL0731]
MKPIDLLIPSISERIKKARPSVITDERPKFEICPHDPTLISYIERKKFKGKNKTFIPDDALTEIANNLDTNESRIIYGNDKELEEFIYNLYSKVAHNFFAFDINKLENKNISNNLGQKFFVILELMDYFLGSNTLDNAISNIKNENHDLNYNNNYVYTVKFLNDSKFNSDYLFEPDNVNFKQLGTESFRHLTTYTGFSFWKDDQLIVNKKKLLNFLKFIRNPLFDNWFNNLWPISRLLRKAFSYNARYIHIFYSNLHYKNNLMNYIEQEYINSGLYSNNTLASISNSIDNVMFFHTDDSDLFNYDLPCIKNNFDLFTYDSNVPCIKNNFDLFEDISNKFFAKIKDYLILSYKRDFGINFYSTDTGISLTNFDNRIFYWINDKWPDIIEYEIEISKQKFKAFLL